MTGKKRKKTKTEKRRQKAEKKIYKRKECKNERKRQKNEEEARYENKKNAQKIKMKKVGGTHEKLGNK